MKPKYLLDTTICIYSMKRTLESVSRRMEQCAHGDLVMSSITYAELAYGVLCSGNPEESMEQLSMLVRAVPVVPFDVAAATAYAPIRLATKARKSDMLDKLIAAQAAALGVIVVTNNVDDFKVYPGIQTENWAT